MKKNNLFLILVLLGSIGSIQASEGCWNQEVIGDAILTGTFQFYSLACKTSGYALGALFCPGQTAIALKNYDLSPTRCEQTMNAFKEVQCGRFCMFTGAACALGAGSLACSACGLPGAAAVAGAGSKTCLAGACITPQIPYQFSFEEPTGRSKDD